MHPAWESLMSAYTSDSKVLIASADCQTNSRSPGTGASLCTAQHTTYFPHIVYGQAGNLKAYDGDRDLETLKAFVESHAGPSPGPSPPSPPAPPSPPTPPTPPSPPSPSSSHYEEPPCQSDETEVEVQGISGSMCSPACSNSQCPSDVPAGVSASPQCVLQDSQGDRYCALECSSDGDCDTQHGASCQILQNFGLCTYPESRNGNTCPITLYASNSSKPVVV